MKNRGGMLRAATGFSKKILPDWRGWMNLDTGPGRDDAGARRVFSIAALRECFRDAPDETEDCRYKSAFS